MNDIVTPSVTGTLDSIAEYFIQFDEPGMRLALEDYEFCIKDSLLRDGARRTVKNAKGDYQTLWWGLASFLFLGDYSAEQLVLKTMKNMLPEDRQLQFLITNIAPLRKETGEVGESLILAAYSLYLSIEPSVRYFDLDSGYFRRNTHNIADEWDDVQFHLNRLKAWNGSYEELYRLLVGLLKFRLFVIGFMPLEVMAA